MRRACIVGLALLVSGSLVAMLLYQAPSVVVNNAPWAAKEMLTAHLAPTAASWGAGAVFAVADDDLTLVDTSALGPKRLLRTPGCPIGWSRSDGRCICPFEDAAHWPSYCRVPLFQECVIAPRRQHFLGCSLPLLFNDALMAKWVEPLAPLRCWERCAAFLAEHGIALPAGAFSPRLFNDTAAVARVPKARGSLWRALEMNATLEIGPQFRLDVASRRPQMLIGAAGLTDLRTPFGNRHPDYGRAAPLLALRARAACGAGWEAANGTCVCSVQRSGANCSAFYERYGYCFAGGPTPRGPPCFGRGVCRAGFCHCTPGVGAGVGCSIDVAWHASGGAARAAERADAETRVRLPRVFVYDLELPLALPFWAAAHGELESITWFGRTSGSLAIEAALTSPFRVLDPEQADLFLLPLEFDRRRVNAAVVVRMLAARWPFFNRSGGADHLWPPEVDDRGRDALLDPNEPLLARMLVAAHFDLLNGTTFLKNPLYRPSNVRGRDYVIPAWNTDFCKAFTRRGGSLVGAERSRYHLLFAGTIYPEKDFAKANGNIRLIMQETFANVSAAYYVGPHIKDFADGMMRANFCLGMPGMGGGYGVRLDMAVAAGCVPVFTNPDRARRYEEIVPWDAVSLTLPLYIGRADAVQWIERVTPAQLARMQAELRCLRRFFCSSKHDEVHLQWEALLMAIALGRGAPPNAPRPLDPFIRSVCNDLAPRFARYLGQGPI